ncbi:4-hydroxybenzoate polyprenyltransferase, mitochondrial-like isoform X1 [Varroa jacobsoni]|uniref:4-hydroxybenzoate polyprenyltransferase, mitochondrial-like isoform X1 n=1 Tax=Varroa jacobsoni TaxID=62625 RepID=UPI000BF4B8C5|nr:4-hydroxybenzoate polyprenyltransferase, mitochondrial-like isoform X1 [Varroa jacobsoni]XP_022706432.1 4-hydroxybenzoate polyprenyltransferase, mitochondrial-like isoform X1 [Varroa jacobsoni]XP_022706433.1 4-hydroxybenzoate polyprenyltransferase, mitochondrial-like isoform X1 [Varroa jacobsoni]XP_022706434.1 4-hydroxybenzoate polyprenyltransferase, mitochondrial-like isoform X1 [Varroa jacobsoni]
MGLLTSLGILCLRTKQIPRLNSRGLLEEPRNSRATFIYARSTWATRTNDNVNISNQTTPKAQDIKTVSLERFVSVSPSWLQPYLRLMRIERPVGTWLTLLPSLWALTTAAPAGSLPDPRLAALFCTGALLMRGFGCTINDMWDRDIDRQVERTRQRPLAAGRLSRWDALWFAGGQAGLACLVLLHFNWNTVMLGLASVGLVVIYPVMKRFTYWPQAILAVVFNWGALLGFSAVQGADMSWTTALPMYAGAFSWTLIYDTIYAHQDKRDDLLVGMKSTALRFGARTPLWLGAFSTSMTTGLIVAGITENMGWPYYAAIAASSALLTKQVATLKIDDPADCAKKFVAHRNIGLLVLLGCIGGSLLKSV